MLYGGVSQGNLPTQQSLREVKEEVGSLKGILLSRLAPVVITQSTHIPLTDSRNNYLPFLSYPFFSPPVNSFQSDLK